MRQNAHGTRVPRGLMEKLASEAGDLRSEFKELWLRTSPPEGLDLNLKRYDELKRQFSELARTLRSAPVQ